MGISTREGYIIGISILIILLVILLLIAMYIWFYLSKLLLERGGSALYKPFIDRSDSEKRKSAQP